MSIQTILQKKLSQRFPDEEKVVLQPVGGGSINDSYKVLYGKQQLFCKINSATKFPHLFETEKQGLDILAKQKLILTPGIVEYFEAEDYQLLLLQWIPEGSRTKMFWRTFGEQLAALHLVTQACHGLHNDNYMGSVPQQNTKHKLWSDFFTVQRLMPMVKRCADKSLLNKKHQEQVEAIQKMLPSIFEEEPPSLLHGDLWSGNFMCNEASEPVLIDPAVYFGHRSVDLGMTTLFGGFHSSFYEAYNDRFPLPSNYKEQWEVCNLYPLLIHLFLFGSGYLPQIERTLKQFS